MRKMSRQDLPPPIPTSGSDVDSQSGSDYNPCYPTLRRFVDKYTPTKMPSSASSTSRTPGSASTSRRIQPFRPSKVTYSVCPQIVRNPPPPVVTSTVCPQIVRKPVVKNQDPVQVYCRVRPLQNREEENCIRINDDTSLTLLPSEAAAWKSTVAKQFTYSFEKVFNDSVGQKEIFNEVSLPLVQDLLEGKSGLLFAYGVTGSGKTFTMSGTPGDPGVMPRTIDVIFNSIKTFQAEKNVFKPDRMNGFEAQSRADAMYERQKEMNAAMAKTPRSRGSAWRAAPLDTESLQRVRDETVLMLKNRDSFYSVFITYVEIYNNFVYDLLDETPIEMHKKAVLQTKMLREDANHNIYVNGVTEIEVESSEEALEVYQRGQKRRRMAHTALNTESSRSHSIFNIRVVQAPVAANGDDVFEEKELIDVGQLSLVDLAGSERYGRTGATGDRLKEAGRINSSLMTLRQCMDVLRHNQQNGNDDIVPYRNTKVTHFLKSFFEGEGRVRMILCVNPKGDDYDENAHVMSFAELTQEVQVTRAPAQRMDPMTPGRRKANELYREAKKRLVQEEIISEDDLPQSDAAMVFGLGPPLPISKMTKAEEGQLLANLRKALELRVKGRAELHSLILEKRNDFRARIVSLEGEMAAMRDSNQTLNVQLSQVVDDKESAENVLRTVQFEKSELEIKVEDLERQNKELNEQLENSRMEARQLEMAHMQERNRLKSDLDLQRELDALKQERQRQKEEEKLQLESSKLDARHLELAYLEERTCRKLRSDSDLHRDLEALKRERQLRKDEKSKSDFQVQELSRPSRIRSRSTDRDTAFDPTPIAMANPRRARSQSTDKDTWLEHTPALTVKSRTVFQPVMKKKKSVQKLINADDIVRNTSKYCLRTDVRDSDGDVETQLYKADVLNTVTGGAQVVFNDVEILKQKSPTDSSSGLDRKRSASRTRTPTRNGNGAYDDDAEALSAKCSMGIGHHISGSGKRSRQN